MLSDVKGHGQYDPGISLLSDGIKPFRTLCWYIIHKIIKNTTHIIFCQNLLDFIGNYAWESFSPSEKWIKIYRFVSPVYDESLANVILTEAVLFRRHE